MIARLRGEVWEAGAGKLVVGCAGVGYEVNVPESVLAEFGIIGVSVDLFVRQTVREDDVSLFGFANGDQRRLFDLLREVKGCGARISMAVIGTLGEETAIAAIATGDVRTLVRVSGVGVRLAERMVVDLKDKMSETRLLSHAAIQARLPRLPAVEDDLVEALVSLGYPRARVEPVADDVKAQSDDLAEQIRLALQRMAR